MQKWEYTVLQPADEYKMTALGEEGWELVNVVAIPAKDGTTSLAAYFKRPVQADTAPPNIRRLD
jgi:hypothetical protein